MHVCYNPKQKVWLLVLSKNRLKLAILKRTSIGIKPNKNYFDSIVDAVGASLNTSAAASQSSAYAGVASASAIPDDEEGGVQAAPLRIPSRSSKNKERTQSEINSKTRFIITYYIILHTFHNGEKAFMKLIFLLLQFCKKSRFLSVCLKKVFTTLEDSNLTLERLWPYFASL